MAHPVVHKAEFVLLHHVFIEEMTIWQVSAQRNRQEDQSREAQVPGEVEDWLLEERLLFRVGSPAVSGYHIVVAQVEGVPQLIALRHIIENF